MRHSCQKRASSPLPQQRHQRGAQKNTNDHKRQPLVVPRALRIKQKVPRQQLHQPRVDQDARADGIKQAIDHIRRVAAAVIRGPQAQANGNGNWRRQAVPQAQRPRQPGQALRDGYGRQARADAEALEGLVEHEHRVQDGEFGAGGAEVEPDEDGVEDDAELEDQEGGDLLLEGALRGRGVRVRVELFHVGRGGAFVDGVGRGFGFDGGADHVLLVAGVEALLVLVGLAGGDDAFDIRVAVHVAVLDFDVALGGEVEQEY